MLLTVLVVISIVGEGNLPSKTAVACVVVSSRRSLGVEDSLSQCQPLGLVRWGIRELELSGQHCRHTPETLIIVSERGCDVGGHVVLARADLPHHGLHDEVVVS